LHGIDAVSDFFALQLGAYADHNERLMGGHPLLIGEIGLPYDLNGGEAFTTGDYRAQRAFNEATYRALDQTLVHSTQWNYAPHNTHAAGDGWNHEDFSIFSPDDQHDPDDLDSGGRGTEGFCRPRVVAAAGVPRRQSFDPGTGHFELEVDSDPAVAAACPTEVYVPRLHYPAGVELDASAGEAVWDPATQRASWNHPGVTGKVVLVVRRR
jgi:hypothetical protein